MQIEASRGMALLQFNSGQVGQRPPPPPSKDALSDVMEQAKSDPQIRDFLQSVREASASGSFDAEALAELAANEDAVDAHMLADAIERVLREHTVQEAGG